MTASETAGIDCVRVDADLVGREHIADAFREATRPIYEATPASDRRHYDASIAAFNVDGLVVSRVRFGATHFERRPGPATDDATDCITVQHYLSGSIRGHVGEHELHSAPDRISFQDFSVPYAGRAVASEVLGVVIPRDRIVRYDLLRSQRPAFSLRLDTAGGALVAGALRQVWTDLGAGRVDEPATVGDAFVGLVNALIDHRVTADASEPPYEAMQRFLRERLADPNLGVEALQREFHLSRSTIYRHFERSGGVAAFIRGERLRRCHAELVRPRSSPVAVSAVAARYGFYDASRFSRAFRASYGVAPSELAAAAASPAAARGSGQPEPAEVRTIRSWLRAA